MELASNDGYLLQHFKPLGVPALGVEPAQNVAAAGREKGVEAIVDFFGVRLAETMVAQRGKAAFIIGNNVLAQVPDLNDFTAGIAKLLADDGLVALEFPHLERLIEEVQFDTIYHEHFSYFSLGAIERLAERHKLRLVDVEQIPTHGGSLQSVLLAHAGPSHSVAPAVQALLAHERDIGFERRETYDAFGARVRALKRDLLDLLIKCKREGKTICGYGAPGKGIRCSITAASDQISSTLRSTAIPTSTAALLQACTCRSLRWKPWTRRGLTTCWCCHEISRARSCSR